MHIDHIYIVFLPFINYFSSFLCNKPPLLLILMKSENLIPLVSLKTKTPSLSSNFISFHLTIQYFVFQFKIYISYAYTNYTSKLIDRLADRIHVHDIHVYIVLN